MSNPASVAPIESARLAANQAFIRGRVTEVKRTPDATYSVVVLPAADAYSQPATVEIRSKGLLAKPHEDLTARVAIQGYRRKGGTDRNGETMWFTSVLLVAIQD